MEDRDVIYYLVHKQIVGELSKNEESELVNLLNVESNITLANQLRNDWKQAKAIDEVKFNTIIAYEKFKDTIDQSNIVPLKLSSHKKRKTNIVRILSSLAAIFFLALFAVNFFSTSSSVTHSFDDGAIVHLSDGSRVYLDKDSKISYTKDFEVRNISLEGKAVFEVAKHIGSTFKVASGNTTITVLGTTFSVDNKSSNSQIKVLEGKVQVSQADQTQFITDRESITIDNDGKFIKKENISFVNESFYQANLEYDNTPLTKVLSDIEAKHKVTFKMKGHRTIGICPFTSKSLDDVEVSNIIKILEVTYSAKFEEIEPRVYEISRLNCK